jgi:hypothetical protein
MTLGKHLWTAAEEATLCEAIARGVSVRSIATRLRRPRSSVELRAKRLGLSFSKVARSPSSERSWIR